MNLFQVQSKLDGHPWADWPGAVFIDRNAAKAFIRGTRRSSVVDVASWRVIEVEE